MGAKQILFWKPPIMEKQQANRDVLISLSLGVIVAIVAAASVANLLLPNPVFFPTPTNSAVQR